jgi:UDP-N-acetylmuramate: L-alanyl-gamma-D-glutamyl-meso-diaminopimelate ligase
MILHVLHSCHVDTDYMVGAKLEGFDVMVRLTEQARVMVFEGDEYLSSCLDPRPKFHLYKPQIALVSGIAWDHINVFPTWEDYVRQFSIFINDMPGDGCLVYCEEDAELKKIALASHSKVQKLAYSVPKYLNEQGITHIIHENTRYSLKVFGRHNMQNIEGARMICRQLGLSDQQFFEAITGFSGAGKRLQLLGQKDKTAVFLDFAHSPSKVDATVKAAKELYPDRTLVACLELHTYSSLKKEFLAHYQGTLDKADVAMVFFNPSTIEHKRLEMIYREDVLQAFGRNNLMVYTEMKEFMEELLSRNLKNSVVLLMSSGNFSGIDFKALTENILTKI